MEELNDLKEERNREKTEAIRKMNEKKKKQGKTQRHGLAVGIEELSRKNGQL